MLQQENAQLKYELELTRKKISSLQELKDDILEALPDESPCKHEETGHSILDDIKDLLKPKKRFRLTADDDGHDYIIPANKNWEWCDYMEKFYAASNNGQNTPDEPPWAVRIDNSSKLTFENWREE